MSVEILAGLIAFAVLVVAWILVPTHTEPNASAVPAQSSAS
jgi:hypothetical protein